MQRDGAVPFRFILEIADDVAAGLCRRSAACFSIMSHQALAVDCTTAKQLLTVQQDGSTPLQAPLALPRQLGWHHTSRSAGMGIVCRVTFHHSLHTNIEQNKSCRLQALKFARRAVPRGAMFEHACFSASCQSCPRMPSHAMLQDFKSKGTCRSCTCFLSPEPLLAVVVV